MIQDIAPHKLDNSYHDHRPKADDTVLAFDDDGRLLACIDDGLSFASYREFEGREAIYLFAVDERRYFLVMDLPKSDDEAVSLPEGFGFYTIRQIRDLGKGSELFAAFTAYHLWKWYSSNKYCGVCGGILEHDTKERALRCKCQNIIYPRINPAVIVGVRNGDRILITRYRNGYAHNALIAGFTEIGETLEECVAREVMEEAGIRVRNIRYYKSQPWGMASDLLAGFYCDVDGDDSIKMDEGELGSAKWVKREEAELQPNDLSLTNEMMLMFKTGKDKEAL